jgi:hypothetical protein
LTTNGDGPIVTSATYLPFGPLATVGFGNGTTKTMTYDARYRPVTNVLSLAGVPLSSHGYGHDPAGNITTMTDALDASFNRAFTYDDLNRLRTANTGASLWGTGSYTYDAMGNILTSTLGANAQTFTYQGTPPRLSSVTYDGAGNELAFGASYSSRNERTSGGNQYDGRGVRILQETHPPDEDGAFAYDV